MRELLPDNLALTERLEALPRACQPSGEELRAERDRVSPDVGLLLCHLCSHSGRSSSWKGERHACAKHTNMGAKDG